MICKTEVEKLRNLFHLNQCCFFAKKKNRKTKSDKMKFFLHDSWPIYRANCHTYRGMKLVSNFD